MKSRRKKTQRLLLNQTEGNPNNSIIVDAEVSNIPEEKVEGNKVNENKEIKKPDKVNNVVFICDDGYVMPTCVAITSLIENCNKGNYRIYVITTNVSEEKIGYIEALNNLNSRFTVEIKEINDDSVKGIHHGTDNKYMVATEAALVKFILPSVLTDIDRVLFLDGDIIVKKDLSDIFDIELNNYYLSAVRDLPQVIFKKQLVGEDINGRDYFNSGVMLLNLELMRKDSISEKLIEVKKQRLNENLMDQNVFNIVCGKKMLPMHFKHNVCYLNMYRSKAEYTYTQLNELYSTNYKSMEDIRNDMSICHFSSKYKPWLFFDVPLADEWVYYYYKSPYKGKILIRTFRADNVVDFVATKKKLKEETEKFHYDSTVVPVVFATNNNYAPYLSVTILSLIENAQKNYFYDIYIFHDEELQLYSNKYLESLSTDNVSIKCIDVRKACIPNMYSRAHYSKQMYYRLLIPEILTQYDRVLYLDCDMVVCRDVFNLINQKLEGKTIGAVNNFVHSDMLNYLSSIGIDEKKYINSGMLVINTKPFILKKLKQKCFNVVKNNSQLLCPDQDAINIACGSEICLLNDKWNFQWHHQWPINEKMKLIPIYLSRYRAIKDNPYIIHYTSGIKPWNYPNRVQSFIFWRYARISPFYEEILLKSTERKTEKLFLQFEDKLNNKIQVCNNQSGYSAFTEIISNLSNELKQINEENCHLKTHIIILQNDLDNTRNSLTYRVGNLLLFIPKKIKKLFNRTKKE